MKGRGEKQLRWAFAVALLLHGVALAAGARLPASLPADGGFEEIRVFDQGVAVVVSPVDLVEYPEALAAGDVEIRLPTAEMASATSSGSVPAQPARPRPEARGQHGAAARVHAPRRTASGGSAPAPARPAEAGGPGTQRAADGGGGGGPLGLGAPSARGDLPGMPSGATPPGEAPGSGGGTGSGAGPGSGGGTGGGSGTGEGTGVGPGTGPGSGSGGGNAGAGGGGSEGSFSSRVADRREPEVVWKGSLPYPESAAAEGVAGTVKLKVLVTETGSVGEVEIVSSSGDRRLDLAARDWVGKWRYMPAVQDGKPRRVYTHAAVEFELR